MRALLLLALVLLLPACTTDSEPSPEPTEPSPPTVVADAPADEPVEAVFARFLEAVRQNDAEAVAELARFPIAGAEVDRATFLDRFFDDYLGEGLYSFRPIVLAATPDELQSSDDGRYYYMALDEGDCADEPECSGSAMIFYFAPEGETWVIDEIQFAG